MFLNPVSQGKGQRRAKTYAQK